jgi:hypothetical protein
VREEAGVDVAAWEEFLVWSDPEYRMHAVRAFDDRAREARSCEDQPVFLADAAGSRRTRSTTCGGSCRSRWTATSPCRSG